jgi:hypothetical protein
VSSKHWRRIGGQRHEEVASIQAPGLPSLDDVDPSLLAMLDMLENDELWTESESGGEGDDIHLLLEEEINVEDETLLAYWSAEDLKNSDGPPSPEEER